MITKNCLICEKEFVKKSHTTGEYCSRKCWIWSVMGHPSYTKGKHWKMPEGFGEKVKIWMKGNKNALGSKRTLGMREKYRQSKLGAKNPNWQGGRTITVQGRIKILKPEHPRADKSGYVFRSIVVMEGKVGRYVSRKEVVHHISGNKIDDRPENLWLFKNTNVHLSYHRNQDLTYEIWAGRIYKNLIRKSIIKMFGIDF